MQGINSNNAVPYKRDNNMIGGCISFINSKLEKISLKIFNSQCPKAVEILFSNVKFSDIEIFNSAGDSFDAEFSDIYVEKIISKKSKGECIGVKRGNYYFNKLFLSYCGDKAYSSGEHSFSKINSIKVDNSLSGIVAKDSSSVEVFKYQIENSEKCLWSLRSKFQYNGSLIKIKKENFNCNGSKILADANSLIEYF